MSKNQNGNEIPGSQNNAMQPANQNAGIPFEGTARLTDIENGNRQLSLAVQYGPGMDLATLLKLSEATIREAWESGS